MENVELEGCTGNMLTTIRVDYSHRDGFHIYSSVDVSGLYVASRDASQAFAEVPDAIALLLRLNEGINVVAEPAAHYRRFIEVAKTGKALTHPRYTPMSASRRYVLRARRHD